MTWPLTLVDTQSTIILMPWIRSASLACDTRRSDSRRLSSREKILSKGSLDLRHLGLISCKLNQEEERLQQSKKQSKMLPCLAAKQRIVSTMRLCSAEPWHYGWSMSSSEQWYSILTRALCSFEPRYGVFCTELRSERDLFFHRHNNMLIRLC